MSRDKIEGLHTGNNTQAFEASNQHKENSKNILENLTSLTRDQMIQRR